MRENGINQVELAKKSGLTQGIIGHILNGRRKDLRLTTLKSLSRAFGMGVDEFLGAKSKTRISPLPIISKAVGSPEGAYFSDQDFPVGAGEDYYGIDDPGAFVLIVEGNSMEPTVRAGDRIVVTPNKKCRPGDICVVRLATSGKTFLKRVDEQADTIILKSDNPAYPVLVHKRREIDWMYRVEAIIPK